jgi:hypothetical protein
MNVVGVGMNTYNLTENRNWTEKKSVELTIKYQIPRWRSTNKHSSITKFSFPDQDFTDRISMARRLNFLMINTSFVLPKRMNDAIVYNLRMKKIKRVHIRKHPDFPFEK